MMLVDGEITFASSHDEARLRDPQIAAFRKRVSLQGSAALSRTKTTQAIVEITTRKGERLRHHTRHVRGTPTNVMPRSEVNLLTQSRFNRAIVERTGDRLIVRTVEVPAADGQGAADAIYEFSTSLDLLNASFGEYYWRIHDRLQLEKKVDHDREHCPFRNGPGSIQIWTPESGWSVLPVN